MESTNGPRSGGQVQRLSSTRAGEVEVEGVAGQAGDVDLLLLTTP